MAALSQTEAERVMVADPLLGSGAALPPVYWIAAVSCVTLSVPLVRRAAGKL